MGIDDMLDGPELPDPDEAEVKLDLCGERKVEAMMRLEKTMADCAKSSAASLFVFFDPATPVSGETLFQPVGKHLRDAKNQGIVERCYPVMQEERTGFYVKFVL